MRMRKLYLLSKQRDFIIFFSFVTFLSQTSVSSACTTGSIQVSDCVRYICEHGNYRSQDCAAGLVPSLGDPSGCAWPGESACTTSLIQERLTDPCADNPCKNGRCIASNDKTAFVCVCYPGYRGRYCHIDIDDCIDRPCKNGATCHDLVNNFRCQCTTNFTGSTCDNKVSTETTDSCSSQPCLNNGNCYNNGTSFVCICTPGFTGQTCQIKQVTENPCLSNPCMNGGVCIPNESNGTIYTCQCTEVFTGNKCDLKMETIMDDKCSNGQDYLPHPEYCQLYYNCSSSEGRIPGQITLKYLDECPYPLLFDDVSRRCAPFTQVKCGSRKEVFDWCHYRRQICLGMCRPCEVEHPSCQGKPDGIHENVNKPNSPHYITCFKNRTIATAECEKDQFGIRKRFRANGPGSGKCRSIYEIPLESGGRLPSCTTDGFTLHSDPFGNCSMYYFCLFGKAKVLRCSSGKVFKNTLSEPVCQDPSQVCGPCGTRTEGC